MTIPLSFGWRDVLFSNWPVDGKHLATHLPDRLAVDTYDGTGWMTVVPFRNIRTRPRGFPAQLGMSFPELNLRTYVTCEDESGVYFFSLDVPSALSVVGARLLHRLPYYHARMAFERTGDNIQFSSRRHHPGARPVTFETRYDPRDEWYVPEAGSLAEFLTERRRLYTEGQDGLLRYTDVSHERWTLSPVAVTTETASLFRANGFNPPETDPVHYYSPGVDVVTDWNRVWKTEKRAPPPSSVPRDESAQSGSSGRRS